MKCIIIIFIFITAIACWLGSAEMALAGGRPLPDVMQHTRFIAYTPRSFSVVDGQVAAASENSIREDLKLLRPFFNGLLTYSANNSLETVPGIARDLGYRSVIMGIWDPLSETEIENVIASVKRYPALIAAVVAGNEGLYTKRYQPPDVAWAMQRIKQACPGLPVTTSEPFFLYFEKDYIDFFKSHDLLMPNVHPIFEKWFDPGQPDQAVELVLGVTQRFTAAYTLPLLIKETGVPSGPDRLGFSEKGQALFWSGLFKRFPVSTSQSVVCFEAFDAPWKPKNVALTLPGDHGNEAFWGFFTVDGRAKPVTGVLPQLSGD